jgi:selenocysteine lyase/cysteine desulfurase
MDFRDNFPILETRAYINACSHGALSRQVTDAYHRYLADRHAHGSPWETWMGLLKEFRSELAAFIGASPDEIAVTTSASAGLSSLAGCFDFGGTRRRVVLSGFEFPTVGQIWHAQKPRGADVVHAEPVGDTMPPEAFEGLIDDRTAVVSITHVCYWNGYRLDVPSIVDIAHSQGAPVILDSYQALGAVPTDISSLGVDLMIGGTIKYLLGSAGLGFVYAHPDIIPTLTPTALGWFAQADIFAMDGSDNDPAPSARRFEYGTPPIPNLYAGLAGIRLLNELGQEQVWARINEITAIIETGAKERSLQLATPHDPERRGALMAIRCTDAETLVARLADDGVITSSRGGNLRISPHAYNNEDDIDRLFAGIDRNRRLLA